MKYYLHDTSSFDDEKITELFLNFGYEGLGLFYTLLEKIGKQEKPVKTEVLKAQLKVGKHLQKVWTFMESIGLICSINGETFNEQLLNYGEKYQIKKEKTREKVRQWREKQNNINNVTSYKTVSNPPKVKESKVNINISFDVFWDLYDKKVGNKKLCIQRWNKLTDDERQKIVDTLPQFKASIRDVQFLPYPEKYLNQQRWNDEIIIKPVPRFIMP